MCGVPIPDQNPKTAGSLTHETPMAAAALRDLFAQWPPSYNRLLLSGSLDYCHAAAQQLATKPLAIQQLVRDALQQYQTACLTIYHRYQAQPDIFKASSLGHLEHLFDQLQNICANTRVYPRLDQLTLEDIQATSSLSDG